MLLNDSMAFILPRIFTMGPSHQPAKGFEPVPLASRNQPMCYPITPYRHINFFGGDGGNRTHLPQIPLRVYLWSKPFHPQD